MRTTLTLDPDVAVLVEQAREKTKRSLKEIVNDGLRRGLSENDLPRVRPEIYETPSVRLGGCRLSNLDDIAGVLATAEGDDFR